MPYDIKRRVVFGSCDISSGGTKLSVAGFIR
jgi:hypothetical protein